MEAANFEQASILILKSISGWYQKLVLNLPNILLALLVFMLSLFIARMVSRAAKRFLPRFTKSVSVTSLGVATSYYVVVIVGFFFVLGILNLEKTVTSLLAGAGVIGLALGFAFQEIAANFISGIFIAFREPYRVGDVITIGDFSGTVHAIKLRTTIIRTFQELEVVMPNKNLFTEPFTNYTTTPRRRIDISLGISYSDDLPGLEKVIVDALEDVVGRLKDRPIEVYFLGFGDSSINFEVYVWIEYPGSNYYLRARHQIIMKIKKALDDAGYNIPFPIRTIQMEKLPPQ